MLDYCTYFDSRFLTRGLALYRSLVRHSPDFRLWVLCFDDLAYETLKAMALPEVRPISLDDFERGDTKLAQAKANRSLVEYYFTCTPSLPLYIFKNHPEVDLITYLDADLYFFSSPTPIFEELADSSILIVGHRFSPHKRDLEAFGIYNVGWLSFRRDDEAMRCLRWWREQCLEWCYDRQEDGRFADQKYLDDWPERFSDVVVLQHKGAGLAPWNVENYDLRLVDHNVVVDQTSLVFYHFHRVRQILRWFYVMGLPLQPLRYHLLLKQHIYKPYINELEETARWVSGYVDGFNGRLDSARKGQASIPRRIIRLAKSVKMTARRVAKKDVVMVVGRRVL